MLKQNADSSVHLLSTRPVCQVRRNVTVKRNSNSSAVFINKRSISHIKKVEERNRKQINQELSKSLSKVSEESYWILYTLHRFGHLYVLFTSYIMSSSVNCFTITR